jgi:Zn-finger nucleic acid-binding protein
MSRMTADTLNCPMCGASTKTDAPNCAHCGARLATIACPSCFGMMFVGAKFCSHCGAHAARAPMPAEQKRDCPRCKTALQPIQVGASFLQECARCNGVWVDKVSFEQICSSSEEQAAVLGNPAEIPAEQGMVLEETIRYVPCPECQQFMNRLNFAQCSKVIVDVCKAHGTWFDRDELRRIVEFIHSGGLTEAREREIAELEAKRKRLLSSPRSLPAIPDPIPAVGSASLDLGDVLSAARRLLDLFF